MSTEKTTSNSFTLSFLATHPLTKGIVSKHLSHMGGHPEWAHDTLPNLRDYNMGGGIPYDILVALMAELDTVKMPPEFTQKLPKPYGIS